jgi:single-strand DNA-binding protein
MNETSVTIVGNVVDTPHRRKTETGVSVASFRIASTARRFDKQSGGWIDGDSLYLKVTCWRQLADNVDRSVVKGDPVVVTGRLFTRTYEAEGQRRSSYELEAAALGLDLTRGVSAFSRTRSTAGPTFEVTDRAPGGGEAGGDVPDDHPLGGNADALDDDALLDGAPAAGGPSEEDFAGAGSPGGGRQPAPAAG